MHGMPSSDALLVATGCGLAVLAGDGTWQVANPALGRLLCEPVDALAGTPAHRRLFPGAAGRIDAALAAGEAPAPFEFDYRQPSGRLLCLEVTIALLGGGEGTGNAWLLQAHDVTRARRMQGALEAAYAQQERLAYGFSHDLRSALRAITGFAAHLQRQPLDDEGRAQLARILDAAERADALVRMLATLMHASSAPRAQGDVDLSLLATWAAAELCDANPGREADIVVQPGLRVQGDERQLKVMLEQLLRNAWMFARPGSPVRVRVEGGERDGMLELRVHDEGIGFDMQYADRMFEPFRRLHGTGEGAGHGLGLAIVSTIARRHGGRAWARSQPGGGSTFFVELPVAGAGDGT